MNLIQDNFTRQANILNPEEFTTPIHIIGAGATGSWIAFSLAKMGIQNITIYDFDEVGMHNLPNQMFGLRDINRNKAFSIRNIINLFTGYKIKAKNTKVNGGEPLQGIVFVLTDTMASRKNIYYQSIKNNPNIELMIETRMDLRGGRVYAIDPKNREQTKLYEETLYSDEESEVSACGVSQTVLPSALAIASNAIWKLLNHINDEEVYNETIMDFSNEIIMTQDWKSKKKSNPILKELVGAIIHCDTQIKANYFAKVCEEQSIRWAGGSKVINNTNWSEREGSTCYWIEHEGHPVIRMSSLQYARDMGKVVTKFEELFGDI